MTRTWPVPPPTGLLHLVGDTHTGSIPASRLSLITADIQRNTGKMVPVPAHRVFLGDCSDNGILSEDTTFRAFADGLLDSPWHTVMGNHDIFQDVRTPATWAASYGYATANYVLDFGFAQGIFVGPDSMNYAGSGNFAKICLPAATLAWMKTAHDAYAGDSIIFCHAPLFGTVGQNLGGNANSSNDSGIYARSLEDDANSDTILATLATMPRAKVWASGHSHSPLDATDFIKAVTVGGRTLAHVNTSCIWYTTKAGYTLSEPMRTVWMNYLGDRIEVRFRDHGNGCWVSSERSVRRTITL